MKLFIIILLILFAVFLGISALINTNRLKKIQSKEKKKKYHTPKLSGLHGKDFKKYMDELTKDYR